MLGGANVYEKSLLYVDKMYITENHSIVKGDVFFPAFDENLFTKEVELKVDCEIPYTYLTYTIN